MRPRLGNTYCVVGDRAEIYTRSGFTIHVDASDLPRLLPFTWSIQKDEERVYAKSTTGGWRRMHRFILGVEGEVLVNHWDGDGLNNRRSNLRRCTNTDNMGNTGAYATNKSGFKGVHYRKNLRKWVAKVSYKKVPYYLGLFNTRHEAAEAYNKKAAELFGEFSKPNII